jgi:hypothetical protein
LVSTPLAPHLQHFLSSTFEIVRFLNLSFFLIWRWIREDKKMNSKKLKEKEQLDESTIAPNHAFLLGNLGVSSPLTACLQCQRKKTYPLSENNKINKVQRPF